MRAFELQEIRKYHKILDYWMIYALHFAQNQMKLWKVSFSITLIVVLQLKNAHNSMLWYIWPAQWLAISRSSLYQRPLLNLLSVVYKNEEMAGIQNDWEEELKIMGSITFLIRSTATQWHCLPKFISMIPLNFQKESNVRNWSPVIATLI